MFLTVLCRTVSSDSVFLFEGLKMIKSVHKTVDLLSGLELAIREHAAVQANPQTRYQKSDQNILAIDAQNQIYNRSTFENTRL